MTGMPEFMQGGGLGGMIGGLFGGGRGGGGLQVYGHASGRFIQQGGTPGLGGAMPPSRVIDIALLNPQRPGVEAALAIPAGMQMGEALPLVPPNPGFKEGEVSGEVPEVKGRIVIYWGCGDAVRPGQPKVVDLSNNPQQWAPLLAGRMAPQRAAPVGAQHAHAMGMVGQDMVLWSSAENGDTGLGLFDYLSPATSARWVKDKVLLPPDASRCAVPAGIFAGGGQDAGAMLRMIAYGPESYFSHPAKPANARANWQPEWSVRVRAKSQTMAMLGVDMAGMMGGDSGAGREAAPGQEQERPSEGGLPGVGNILRGIFGR